MTKDGYMESVQEMKENLDKGKILIGLNGIQLVLDYRSKYTPYVYGYDGEHKGCMNPEEWLCFADYKILKEPELETDRNKLIGQVIDRFRSGERFLVRYDRGTWDNPVRFKFVNSEANYYEWTAVDENWQPVGEPQKFVKD